MFEFFKRTKKFNPTNLANIPKGKRPFLIESEIPKDIEDLAFFNCGYAADKKDYRAIGNVELSIKVTKMRM